MRIPAYCLALLAFFTTGCAWFSSDETARHVEPEWRLVPEASVIGQRRQFFLYGRHLDSAKITAPRSVDMQRGALSQGGRVQALYLIVNAAVKDSLADGETVGTRAIEVKTPDTSVTFTLKIVDEALPR